MRAQPAVQSPYVSCNATLDGRARMSAVARRGRATARGGGARHGGAPPARTSTTVIGTVSAGEIATASSRAT